MKELIQGKRMKTMAFVNKRQWVVGMNYAAGRLSIRSSFPQLHIAEWFHKLELCAETLFLDSPTKSSTGPRLNGQTLAEAVRHSNLTEPHPLEDDQL
jgi:hypothetical protein